MIEPWGPYLRGMKTSKTSKKYKIWKNGVAGYSGIFVFFNMIPTGDKNI